MVIRAFLLFSFLSSYFSQNCLTISSSCFTCRSDFYEEEQLSTLSLAFTQSKIIKEENCIGRENQINRRKILIGIKKGDEYDKIYEKIHQALLEEFKIAIKYNNSELIFELEDGVHIVDSLKEVELFRRCNVSLIMQPSGPATQVEIELVSGNYFRLFIANKMSFININFILDGSFPLINPIFTIEAFFEIGVPMIPVLLLSKCSFSAVYMGGALFRMVPPFGLLNLTEIQITDVSNGGVLEMKFGKDDYYGKVMDYLELYRVDFYMEAYFSNVSINKIMNAFVIDAEKGKIYMQGLEIEREGGEGRSLFLFKNSNLDLKEAKFSNLSLPSLIKQTFSYVNISSCSFMELNLSHSLVHALNSPSSFISSSTFIFLKGSLAIFYFESSFYFKIVSSSVLACAFNFFVIPKNSSLFKMERTIFKNNKFNVLCQDNPTLSFFEVISSFFKENRFNNFFFRNVDKPLTLRISDSLLTNNSFWGFALIFYSAGFFMTNSSSFQDNFFMVIASYQNAFALQLNTKVYFSSSFFSDCGILQPQLQPQAAIKNTILYFFYITSAILTNLTFLALQIDLASGFISSGPVGVYLSLKNSSFFILRATSEKLMNKGLLLDSADELELINNFFFNFNCNDRSLAHQLGGVYISSAASGLKYTSNRRKVFLGGNFWLAGGETCQAGGGLAIVSYFNVTLENCLFKEVGRKGGGMVGVDGRRGGVLFMMENQFVRGKCLEVEDGESGEGVIYVEGGIKVEFDKVMMKRCLAAGNGVVTVRRVKEVMVGNADIYNTTAELTGGFIYVSLSNLTLLNSSISHSHAYYGGVLFLSTLSSLFLSNVRAISCSSFSGTFIYVRSSLFLILSSLLLLNLYSSSASSILLLQSSYSLVFRQFFIFNASTPSYAGFLLPSSASSTLLVLEEGWVDGISSFSGSLLYDTSESEVVLRSIRILNLEGTPFIFRNGAQKNALIEDLILIGGGNGRKEGASIGEGAFDEGSIVAYEINLTLRRVTMVGRSDWVGGVRIQESHLMVDIGFFWGEETGVVFLSWKSRLVLRRVMLRGGERGIVKAEDSVIESQDIMIKQVRTEGAFNLIECDVILKMVIFKDNLAGFLEGSKVNLYIDKVLVENVTLSIALLNSNNAMNTFLSVDLSNLLLLNSSLELVSSGFFSITIDSSLFEIELKGRSNNLASALEIYEPLAVSIEKSFFIGFKESAINVFSKTYPASFYVNSSFFLANEPIAVIIEGILNISVTKSTFKGNGGGEAGCFLILKDESVADDIGELLILKDNIFDYNLGTWASAIFSMIPIQSISLNEILNTKGTVFISFPIKIISPLSYSSPVSSGEHFSLNFSIVDAFNQMMSFSPSSLFTIKLNVSAKNPLLIENNLNTSNKGVITFSHVVVKTTFPSVLQTEIVGKLVIFSRKTGRNLKGFKTIEIRPCSNGEVILADMSCRKCSKGTYSFGDPMKENLQCKKCPDNCECPEGYLIWTLPGFYKINFYSEESYACPSPPSCQGLINNYYTISSFESSSNCLEGNNGIFCAYCDLGYGRSQKSFGCESCSINIVTAYLKFVGYVLFTLIYIVINSFLAEGLANKINDSKEQVLKMDTLNKFIVTHIQQIAIILQNSHLPGIDLVTLFEIAEFFSFANPFALVNDCLMQLIYYQEEFFPIFQQIIVSIAPIVLALISFLIWLNLSYILRKSNRFAELSTRIPTSFPQIAQKLSFFLLLSAFMFYSMAMKACFLLFECQKIIIREASASSSKTKEILSISPAVECWSQEHAKNLALGSPGLVGWGIFFPFYLVIALKKSRVWVNLGRRMGVEEIERREKMNYEAIRASTLLMKQKKSEIKQKYPHSIVYYHENKEINSQIKGAISSPLGRSLKQLSIAQSPQSDSLLTEEECNRLSSLVPNPRKVQNKKKRAIVILRLTQSSKAFTFFYQDYQTNCFYWEALIFMRKFLLAFLYTLKNSFPEEIRIFLVVIMIFIYYWFTQKTKPYKLRICNRIEIASLFSIFVAVCGGYFGGTWGTGVAFVINGAFLAGLAALGLRTTRKKMEMFVKEIRRKVGKVCC